MPPLTTNVSPKDLAAIPRGPLGPSGEMPLVIQEGILRAAKERKADEEIRRKWTSLDGAPGNQNGDLTTIEGGFYREYAHGRIYYRPRNTPFWVYGAIGDKYTQLGAPASWLGWPTSDERPFDEGGRMQTFEHGAIYFWFDTGALELGDVVVRYTGLACFAETDWDQGTFGDEPYVVLGIAPVAPVEPSVVTTRVYGEDDDPFGEVDAGDSRVDSIELYRGLPHGIALSAALFEHDEADVEEIRRKIQKAAKDIGDATGYKWLGDLAEFIAGLVVDLLDLGDDFLGQVTFPVTSKTMVVMAHTAAKDFRAIPWDVDSPLISNDEGAAYKVYLDIQPA